MNDFHNHQKLFRRIKQDDNNSANSNFSDEKILKQEITNPTKPYQQQFSIILHITLPTIGSKWYTELNSIFENIQSFNKND